MNSLIDILLPVGAGAIGLLIGYLIRKMIAEAKITSAEEAANRILEDAKKQGESMKREALLEAKEDIHKQRNELEKESRERRNEIQRYERKLEQKEDSLTKQQKRYEQKEKEIADKEQKLIEKEEGLNRLYDKQVEELENLSGLTTQEAKDMLLNRVKDDISHETAMMIKEMESRAKEEADKKARNIITMAIQRCAVDHVAESTVSVVSLPNDEMKGRIIGREGRNIRTLETLTGIDLIIDDTPEAVILSGFDPIRREIARVALENLVSDGRIHPARIEEMVEKAKKEVDERIREEGEQASLDTGVHGLHTEIIKLLGRLRFRTSYGQNVLNHSIEVSRLCGVMANELGIDVATAKRAGLLHDIGKAVDHEYEGPHVTIGAELGKKYGESSDVLHAILTHHGDEEAETLEAVLVQAADAISAARPGARRETLESYIKRLEKLEEIADSYESVEKAFAIQAGREIRIMVKPEQINDDTTINLARDISKQIEAELDYPGQIKVTVIRETRAVEYAK
ncbi:ribonuclease Y [Natranaerobius trueperi]|uniref:Ribonuclease Y n=2 Tax=Natranaerobius trueperi TaxID=759412 RepID=A0A226BXQ6_9FIRM|nr:ribonuclease Y [Natranaerobius trueperi]